MENMSYEMTFLWEDMSYRKNFLMGGHFLSENIDLWEDTSGLIPIQF